MMTRDQIQQALCELGHQSKYWGPSQDTYASLVAGWPAANGPVPTEQALQTAWDKYAALVASTGYIETVKTNAAVTQLGTTQNKTLLDAMWELHRAIRGVIILPTETKAQYADRLKGMWKANEP